MFSMTMGCFSVALIELPSRRAITSPGPPAENGTTIVIGRLGNSCANAGSAGDSNINNRTRFTNCMATSYWPLDPVKQLERDNDRLFIRAGLLVQRGGPLDHAERSHCRRLDVIDAALLGEVGIAVLDGAPDRRDLAQALVDSLRLRHRGNSQ